MNFDIDDSHPAFRREVSTFLDDFVTSDLFERCRRTGTLHDWDLHRALAARGWFAGGWPTEYGGRGEEGSLEILTLSDELELRGIPADGLGMTMLVANVIMHAGSEEMKRSVLPRVISGEILMCLGYTESHGGSDVAAAKTTAVKDGDDWVINGHKMFTTLAHEAEYVFLLTRTNSDVPKHRGLTMFLVPMDAPGVEVHPILTIGDVRTNVTYYSDVVVSDAARVGEIEAGWGVMGIALMYERTGGGADARLLDDAVRAASVVVTNDGSGLLEDDSVRERLGRLAIEREISSLLRLRSQWAAAQGSRSMVEGSMFKLFSAESQVRAASDLLDIFGSLGLIEPGDPAAPGSGEFAHEYRHSIVLPIYGGSSEVQRRIIAEARLGLPRSNR
jgi:alkylation response protein AidB-like acyl-CoA dehydrogenase